MSKKTIKQRIAVVAALALGAGVMSVSPANAAALAANGIDILSTAAGTPGVCTVDSDKEKATVALGLLSGIKVGQNAAGDVEGYLSISGPGTFTGSTQEASGGSADVITFGAGATSVTFNTDSASDQLSFTIKPTATGTISVTTRATSSTGTVLDVITITVATACTSGTYDASKSYAAIVSETNATDEAAVATNVTTTGADVVANSGSGFISIALADAYGASLDSDAIIATVTSGDAFVKLGEEADSNSVVPGAGSAKTSVIASTGAKLTAQVVQSVANKPTVAVVTISYAGTIVTTKTITFQGVAASIDIKDVSVGSTSGSGYFRARVLDAAGNALFSKEVVDDPTANAAEAVSTITSGVTSSATSGSDGDWSATGDGVFGCTKGGVTTLNVRHIVDAATVVKKSFAIACGGALDTWTISLDKASYQPGEIATLTVTGKDSKGNLVNSNDTLGTLEYSFGGMTAITAPTSADKFTSAAGAKKYTFSVGTSEGSFVGTFKITGATDTAAKTVQYTVKSSTTTVTNADVLKSIVSLIASINKQIQALQKLILRR